MNLPNLATATAQEILDHERRRAMTHEQYDRAARHEYLSTRLMMIIEKLIDQRDLLRARAAVVEDAGE